MILQTPRVFQEPSERYQKYFTTYMSMELLGRSLQRFVLDLTESLRNPQQNLYSIHSEIVTDFFQKYRWFTEYLRRNTCTTLTHRHRCPHRNLTGSPQNPPYGILPETSHHNTESLQHPYNLLPATCRESFAP